MFHENQLNKIFIGHVFPRKELNISSDLHYPRDKSSSTNIMVGVHSRASVPSLQDLLLKSPDLATGHHSMPRVNPLFLRDCNSSSTDNREDISDRNFMTPKHMSPSGQPIRADSAPVTASSRASVGVPVFVMLPLDTIDPGGGSVRNPRALTVAMRALHSAGVTGVMIDVWWGLVEREGPKLYDWSAYIELVELVRVCGLQMQAVMSFHACGGNVGDNVSIPLPAWVLDAALKDVDIFYSDKNGHRNSECISLFSDQEPCLWGRSPIEAYADFMAAFKKAMGPAYGSVVTEVAIGMGPCGELRYPSYPEGDGRWRFPGVGEFQCYDKRALALLSKAAIAAGQPDWGYAGPHDAGDYNSKPFQTGFFNSDTGSWNTPYGQFFLKWYSDRLVEHGERMVQAAIRSLREPCSVDSAGQSLQGPHVKLSLKCAGVHWWFHSDSHAAELTAGYYNAVGQNGYFHIMKLCQLYDVEFNFTCVEMRNEEQPPEALCGPQELLNQVRVCAAELNVPFNGENALARWDQEAYDQMLSSACSTVVHVTRFNRDGESTEVDHQVPAMGALTYLRLGPKLFEERNFARFMSFVKSMEHGPAGFSQQPFGDSQYINESYNYTV